MRLVLYSAVLAGGGVIAQSAGEVPVWLYLALSLLGSGFGGKILLDRRDKRWEQRLQDATAGKSEAETREIEERLQKAMIQRAEADYARMSEQLAEERTIAANLRAQLAEARREFQSKIEAQMREFQEKLDEKERRMAVMRAELERLHDEIAAFASGESIGKRRRDPEK